MVESECLESNGIDKSVAYIFEYKTNNLICHVMYFDLILHNSSIIDTNDCNICMFIQVRENKWVLYYHNI